MHKFLFESQHLTNYHKIHNGSILGWVHLVELRNDTRTLDKGYLISQPNYMLWALKRTVSMRQFFWAPKTNV